MGSLCALYAPNAGGRGDSRRTVTTTEAPASSGGAYGTKRYDSTADMVVATPQRLSSAGDAD